MEVYGHGPVGEIGLLGLDNLHRRAELRISIGDRESWGCGYGTEAIQLVIAFCLDALGLRRVWLITDADNQRSIHAFEKCGFVKEGVLRGHRLREGKPTDMIVMRLTRAA